MVNYRRFGVMCLLLLAVAAVWANPLDSRRMPDGRFRDWSALQMDFTANHIAQVWRQPLTNLPKGVDGYLMVSYQVTQADSPIQAAQNAAALLQKKRFNDYIARGYTVTPLTWQVADSLGAQFVVRGLSHNSEPVTAHRAEIFTYATSKDEWLIWLEVRQVSTAKELDVSDRSLQHANGREIADELVTVITQLWSPTPTLKPAPTTPTTPAPTPESATPVIITPPAPTPAPVAPTTPASTPDPATPVIITPPAPTPAPSAPVIITPPAPVAETPATPSQTAPVLITPPAPVTPATPAAPASEKPAPAAPTIPVSEQPMPTAPAAATPATPATPATTALPSATPTPPSATPSTPAPTAAPAAPATPATPAALPSEKPVPAAPTPVAEQPAPATPVAPAATPPTAAAPATPVTPATPAVEKPAPVTPPTPAPETPATPAQPSTTPAPATAVPATPVAPAPAAPAPPAATTPAPPVTPAPEAPAAVTPAAPVTPAPEAPATVTPATPAVKRWQTDDGGLSLVLPDGWNVSGKNIYLFSGLADATVRLFLPDTYNTAKELQEDVQDFAATHKEISAAHFAQQNCTFDGATGMRVSYTNVAKRTTLAYYFGKSGHLWRIEADLPGENTPIPDVLTRLVNSIRVK